MSDSVEAGQQPKSALVFGARNLGRAVVEALLREGWQVAAAARSDATLQAVREARALAVRADVTDADSVEAALREAAEAHGPVGLVVNAAAAYGGDRSGPFGGGPLCVRLPVGGGAIPARAGHARDAHPGDRRIVAEGDARSGTLERRFLRRAGADTGVHARTARPRHPRGPAHHRRRHRAHVRRAAAGREPRGARRSATARRRGALPCRARRPLRNPRAPDHTSRGDLGALGAARPAATSTAARRSPPRTSRHCWRGTGGRR